MTVSLRGPIAALTDFLAASGRFAAVAIGEPFKAPQSMTAAVLLKQYAIPETTLTGPVEQRAVTVRIYRNATDEPREDTELELDDTVSELLSAICGDFDLGGGVRSIDVTRITATFGFQTIDSTIYRIADITLPLIVDDSATFGQAN